MNLPVVMGSCPSDRLHPAQRQKRTQLGKVWVCVCLYVSPRDDAAFIWSNTHTQEAEEKLEYEATPSRHAPYGAYVTKTAPGIT